MNQIISRLAAMLMCLYLPITSSYAETLAAPNATTINLTITKSCTLNSQTGPASVNLGTLNFGSVSGLPSPVFANAHGAPNGISVRCTPNTPVNVKINKGLNESGGLRRLRRGSTSDYLTYEIYTNAARTNIWNSTTGWSYTFLDDVTRYFPIYGRVHAQPTAVAGTYTDQLAVTLEF